MAEEENQDFVNLMLKKAKLKEEIEEFKILEPKESDPKTEEHKPKVDDEDLETAKENIKKYKESIK